jgi:sec-independent protein translocase protein TatA
MIVLSMLTIILFLESIGTGELLVILMFVLFFFGSKKIPELARGLGRGMREMKDAVQGIKNDIHENVNFQEEKKMIDEIKKDLDKPGN